MPDGESVLYATGNELDVVQLKSGAMARYAELPGRAFWPRWSPSGNSLRFTLIDPLTHVSSLWQLNPSTRKIHALPLAQLHDQSICCGSWSADGRFYVFQSTDARGSDIWAMATGPNAQILRLTNGPLSYISPLPSRTENNVFFVGLDPPAETRIFDSTLQRFVPAPAFLEHARRVTYSRDGRWVAWVDVDGRLWRALRDNGSERLQLTPDDLDVFLAQWSPDQSQLVVMAREPGQTWQLYLVSATGGLVRKIYADKRNVADPDWSADGRRLVFGREADLMGKESGSHDIQLLDLKSMKTEVLPDSAGLFSPRWSPDGRWIVALSLDQTRLLLCDLAARRWRTLTTSSAADPVWSLDSKSVYFHAFADPKSAILRVVVSGGSAERVADMSNLQMPKVDSYFFSGITPAGAPIVEPRIGTGNLFSIRLPE
jgi:Tol biopolymer transport system component